MARISSKRLDFLFRPPTVEPIEGSNSTVHLVRRECQDTLANLKRTADEASFPGRRNFRRLFASTIVICSAFDLLGKLRYGDAQHVNVSFTRLLERYGGVSRIESRRIWNARNALVHSFGVRIMRRGGRVSSVRIQLTETTAAGPVVRVGRRRWQISVPALYRLLTRVIRELEGELRRPKTADQVALFNRMFIRYGRIRIRF
jgi:hypothetical protein